MQIEQLIADHGRPLPELSTEERQALEMKARCVKAGLIERTTIERQHRTRALYLDSELPHLQVQCDA